VLETKDVLFGWDATPGIVAVEFVEPGQVEVFLRQADGKTLSQVEPLRPFLWTGVPIPGAEALQGGEDLGHLLTFEDWTGFQDSRNSLKAANAPCFAFGDPIQHYLTASGRTFFKGMTFEDLRRMQIDIETDSTEGFGFSNAARDSLTAIAVADSSGWEDIFVIDAAKEGSEKEALEWLTRLIAERDPDVLEGHNIFRFDLPFLMARAKKHKVKLTWGRGGQTLKARSSRLQIAEKTIQYPKATVYGRHVVDTYLLAQFYDVSSRELESFGLKAVAQHFGLAEEDRVILKGEEIQDAWKNDPEAFRTYALQDVRETRALSATLSRSYFVQAGIFPYGYQDVIVRGNATKIDTLFLRTYLHERHSLPQPPEARSFEGGSTDVFITGVLQDVWHCDVTSLYPSVMLSFGLTPPNDGLGIFRNLLADLRSFRLKAKEEMKAAPTAADRSRLDALQSTFKILINSFYGYLGFSQGHFADFEVAAEITRQGRAILHQMVDWLKERGAAIIEIDTDGIYFQPPAGATMAGLDEELSKVLPAGIEVEFDKMYRAMFSYKAKNYALLDLEGKLHIKGAALKSRGMEPYLRDYLQELLQLLLESRIDDASALRDRYAVAITERQWPIERLAKTEALQDSLANYQKKITASSRNRSAAFELALKSGRAYQAGDQVTYYITGVKKKVTAYDHARFTVDWNPESRDENTAYYLAKLDDLAGKFAEFLKVNTAQQDLFA